MLSALYEFCRDQGSIIGGLLALAAGYLVFRGATRAADRQVSAAHALRGEFVKYLCKVDPYHNDKLDCIALFVSNIRVIISGELEAWRSQAAKNAD
jgi:hypothetical protein